MSNDIAGKVVTTRRTMRAGQITAFRRPIQVVEVPVVAPRADGALVRLKRAGSAS